MFSGTNDNHRKVNFYSIHKIQTVSKFIQPKINKRQNKDLHSSDLGQSWDLGIFWRGDRLSMCHSLQIKPIYGDIMVMSIIRISVNLNIYLIESKHCQLV
jgi:hypothetical protein